jgi:hypothetical protein
LRGNGRLVCYLQGACKQDYLTKRYVDFTFFEENVRR